jgi:hypothetical protein
MCPGRTEQKLAEGEGFELEALWRRSSRKPKSRPCRDHGDFGGGGGIRTPGTLSGPTVFKTAGLNRSPTPPFFKSLKYSSLEWLLVTDCLDKREHRPEPGLRESPHSVSMPALFRNLRNSPKPLSPSATEVNVPSEAITM